MEPAAFLWLHRAGHAPAALVRPGRPPAAPLVAQPLDGAALLWLPLDRVAEGQARLAALPPGAMRLFPAGPGDVPGVVAAWLALYERQPAGLREAVLQVVDEPAHLLPYLDAEDALWAEVYRAHPHVEGEGLYPRALAEARWLACAILDHPERAERAEFLTLAALETVARELLLTVRRAELVHLRDHLAGVANVMGW